MTRTHYRHQHHQSTTNVLLLERRLLFGVTGFTLIGCLLWIISISTDYWYVVPATQMDRSRYASRTASAIASLVPDGSSEGSVAEKPVDNNPEDDYDEFVRSHGGLWRMCRTIARNTTDGETLITTCSYLPLFPSRDEVVDNPMLDHNFLDYTRTETAFCIITFLLMMMGQAFSFYTFREPRYMFKRLAGGVHFLTAATILVVVEVLSNSVQYASEKLPERHPTGMSWRYGFSYILAWMSFVTYVTAGLTFIVCSRKRKDDKAGAELASLSDEPHILSR